MGLQKHLIIGGHHTVGWFHPSWGASKFSNSEKLAFFSCQILSLKNMGYHETFISNEILLGFNLVKTGFWKKTWFNAGLTMKNGRWEISQSFSWEIQPSEMLSSPTHSGVSFGNDIGIWLISPACQGKKDIPCGKLTVCYWKWFLIVHLLNFDFS